MGEGPEFDGRAAGGVVKPLRIGRLRVDLLSEVAHRMMPVSFLFNDLTPDDMRRNADWLGPDYLDPDGWQLGLAFQAYVIRTPGPTILVDSCNGNHKQRPTAPWQHDFRASTFMDNLAALDLRPEDIDIVLCTHLHCDHVGWNTRLEKGRWVPTFPNARYIFNRAEFDFYNDKLKTDGPLAVNHGAFVDSVLPVVEAGLVDYVEDHSPVITGAGGDIFLSAAPGHSFGHVCVHARAGDEEAIVCGDVLHHPIQCDMPNLKMRADLDPDLAIRTRNALLSSCADSGALLLAGHVPFMSIGRVSRLDNRFRLASAA
jgi:glyoxylase-like metal-dependent hydrolase (beta-lactamase superfamily II)